MPHRIFVHTSYVLLQENFSDSVRAISSGRSCSAGRVFTKERDDEKAQLAVVGRVGGAAGELPQRMVLKQVIGDRIDIAVVEIDYGAGRRGALPERRIAIRGLAPRWPWP